MVNRITLYFILASLTIAQPNVDLIEPAFGGIGGAITISGNNFISNTLENSVFFGGLEANILNSTENEIIVSVPNGAYYTSISVYANGLYAASSQRFDVTFDATEELTVAHLSNQLNNPHLGRKYYDIKIADMNGDNIAEIVTSEFGYGSSAYLAIFTTSFDDEGMISIDQHIEFNFGTGVYSEAQDIALGDLNGDGFLDVVVSEEGDVTDDFDAHTCIFINTSQNQSFSFDAPIIISGDGYEGYVQLQDINGDGKLDIVTSRQTYNQLGIYLNTSDNSSVSFADKIIIENVVAPRPAFADLNGDGMIDMVATAYLNNGRDVYIYSNNSTEENIDFNLEFFILAGGEPPGDTDWNWSSANPTLADIDGDGKLDIVVTNGNCGFGCSVSGVSIIRNISTDSELDFEYDYSSFYQYESNSWPLRVSASDLNGDGKPDLLTNDWLGGISILVNNSNEGNIEFEDQMQIGVGSYPLSVATADLNMDFTPEIIVANWNVEGLRVIHNFLPVEYQVNNPPTNFSLSEPSNNTQITVDESNMNTGFITFSWSASSDANGDSLYYLMRVTSAEIGNHDMDTNAPFIDLSYIDIIEDMSENNVTAAVLEWTVHVTDGIDTVEADNAPYTMEIDGANALSAYLERLIADEFAIHQNYPNPFNPVTTLRYDLPENGHVNITIYDMLGREVKTLINQTQDAGYRSVIWNATNDYGKPVSAGIYLYQIQVGEYISTKKMVLLK